MAQELEPLVPEAPATFASSPARYSWLPAMATPTVAGEPSALRWRLRRWLGLDHRYTPAPQPRLAMTAAMAFLSICLTLNLLGVSVTQLHAQDLRTDKLQRSVQGKGETLLRSIEGLQVVYQVESRVSGWLVARGGGDGARLRQ